MSRVQTFDEFFTETYLPQARARKRSWTLDDRLARRHISPSFGARAMDAITPADVHVWLCGLRRHGFAPSSCNRILALLKSVFSLAISTGQIAYGRSPCRDVKSFRIVNARERFLSREEGKRLLDRLDGIDRLEARIISMLLLTGARKGEILKARWEDVDWENRRLRSCRNTHGKTRWLDLSDAALNIFRELQEHRNGDWIFPGRKPDRPLADLFVFRDRLRNELGIPQMKIEDLRFQR